MTMNAHSIDLRPKISCIIPCFNEDPTILRRSLTSIINQTYNNFECLVIDESTNAKTVEACREICNSDPRFHYFHPEQRVGLAGSLNLGIQEAKGEFIARFDSDDICSSKRFSLQVKFLDENPEIGVVGSSLAIIDNQGDVIGHRVYPSNHESIEKKFIFSNGMAHPTVMFRKSVLQTSGGAYDPTFRYAEDLEFWLRLLNCKVIFANLSEPLVKYRQQFTNRSKENWKCNIRARIKNYSSPYRFKKIIGISCIALWMIVPIVFQRFLFQINQLKKA